MHLKSERKEKYNFFFIIKTNTFKIARGWFKKNGIKFKLS